MFAFRSLLALSLLLVAGLVALAVSAVSLSHAVTLPNDVDGHVHMPGVVTDSEICGSYVRGAENSGYQTNPSSYAFSQPSPLGIAGAAGARDFHWVHDSGGSSFIVWDMGDPKAIVDVFPSIDHGPVPEEALEFTVYGTNDLAQPETSWEIGDITTIFDEGWDATWIADNWVSRWQFTTHYRYVGVHWGGPKALWSDGDAEIDAVCAPTNITNCGRYADENAMINDSRPLCRATYIYDAGQGNTVSRQDLLDTASYFTSQGFDTNFLWYAPKEVVQIQPTDTTTWSSCSGAEHLGTTCPAGHTFHPISDAFSGKVTLNFWKFGNTFISQACGNFSATQSDVPIPKISGYKFNDLNSDGIWQTGTEGGVPNWPITLTDPDGNTYQTETDLDGKYTFDVTSRPGKYTVTEGSRDRWISTTAQSIQVIVTEGVGDAEFANNNFGNHEIGAQITIIKHVINDHGGTAVAGDWTMDITGANVSSTGFPGQEAPGVTVALDAGAYSVGESGGPAGYAATFSADCSGTIAGGETKTCTITNDDIPQDEEINIHVNSLGAKQEGTCWGVFYEDPIAGKAKHDVVGDNVGGVKPDCGEPSNLKLSDSDPAGGVLSITITSAQRVQFGDIWHVQNSFSPIGKPDPNNYECDLSLGKCTVPKVTVGGLVVDLDKGPLSATEPPGGNARRLAGTIAGIAALALALTGAAWYARRRLLG